MDRCSEGAVGAFFNERGELVAEEVVDFFDCWTGATGEGFKPGLEHADFLDALAWGMS